MPIAKSLAVLRFQRLILTCVVVLSLSLLSARSDAEDVRRLLYVASPGVRNYEHWGGHGVLVFDMDHGHEFVRRIPLDGYGLDADGNVLNVKGICAHAETGRLFVSTLEHLICLDLQTDQVNWQHAYDQGCDRMSVSPDGAVMYLPSLEKEVWYVIDAATGEEITRLDLGIRSHNTVCGLDGEQFYLAGLGSSELFLAKTGSHAIERTIGPFSDSIRPFTVNGSQTLVFVNVNELLGFEVGDLRTGEVLHRVEVSDDVPRGKPDRHGCPSHGIGLTPDETELWVCDGFNSQLHIYDATVLPPKPTTRIKLREQPGWVTFSLDGTRAYPSTGEVIDVESKQIIARLTDEEGREVHSEKMLEIQFENGAPVRNGDQFGLGRVRAGAGT